MKKKSALKIFLIMFGFLIFIRVVSNLIVRDNIQNINKESRKTLLQQADHSTPKTCAPSFSFGWEWFFSESPGQRAHFSD